MAHALAEKYRCRSCGQIFIHDYMKGYERGSELPEPRCSCSSKNIEFIERQYACDKCDTKFWVDMTVLGDLNTICPKCGHKNPE